MICYYKVVLGALRDAVLGILRDADLGVLWHFISLKAK
jgi:hypothetical protein